MKNKYITIPTACAAAMLAVTLASPLAKANMITGSVGFGALGVSINTSTLATASTFSLTSPFVTTESGSYAVPEFTSVAFTGFSFNQAVSSVTPLWTFTVGGITYSFDATSVSSLYDATHRQWDISGSGIAMITGFDATPGSWTVNLSQTGAALVFDASEASNVPLVPDSGSSVALLGGALLGLSFVARKLIV